MDLITNYHGFGQNIKDSFEDLIQEFDLKLIEPHEGYYLLLGAKCNIRFTYDRGDISCQFKQVSESHNSPWYHVGAAYKFFYPFKEAPDKSERFYDFKLQLAAYSDTVKKLKNVLNGDFSWLDDFNEKQEKENKILDFILHLDYNNPIQKKFWAGDLSWRQDIEK